MFKSTGNKGFSMTFENGLTISVQFGHGNYCSNHNNLKLFGNELKQQLVESNTAEIAIWDKNNNWFNFGHDQVKGWCSANEVAEWIRKTSNAKSIKTIRRK